MNDKRSSSDRVIRRILVALDASPHSEAALQTAAQLAAVLQAELHGIFVEDEDLLRLADLPQAREISAFTTPARTMTPRRVGRQLRRQADRARRALHEVARRFELEHDFSVVRGRVAAMLVEAAAEADLISIGKASSRRSSRRKLGQTARTVLEQASSSVLVLRSTLRDDGPLMVYYDGTPPAESALRLAVTLARQRPGTALTVLLPAVDADEIQRLNEAITDRYGPTVPGLHVHPLTQVEAARLATVVHHRPDGLIILPDEAPPLRDANLQTFLYDVDQPVLVVR